MSDYDTWLIKLKKELKTETPKTTTLVDGKVAVDVLARDNSVITTKKWYETTLSLALVYKELKDIEKYFKMGVRSFHLMVDEKNWDSALKQISPIMNTNPEITIVLQTTNYSTIKFISNKNENYITAVDVERLGADFEEQLQYVFVELNKLLEKRSDNDYSPINIEVVLNEKFFASIAAVQALKVGVDTILNSYYAEKKPPYYVWGRPSLRHFSLLDFENNSIKNGLAISAALVSGCDFVSSISAFSLHELSGYEHQEFVDKFNRLAFTSFSVLQQESHLSVIKNAYQGSFLVEDLTRKLLDLAWAKFQTDPGYNFANHDFSANQNRLKDLVAKRKLVITGVNDFPRSEATFIQENNQSHHHSYFRLAYPFEQLRMKFQKLNKKPTLYIAHYGNFAKLNLRLSFCQNYFELIGANILKHDAEISETSFLVTELNKNKPDVVIWCLLDQDSTLVNEMQNQLNYKPKLQYMAGKNTVPNTQNIFAGQDVVMTLETFLQEWK